MMSSRHVSAQLGLIVRPGLGERRLGELCEEGVRLAVDDAIALLDRGAADGLGEMALARTGRPEQERVFALGDEAGGGELEDERSADLLVEGVDDSRPRAACFGVVWKPACLQSPSPPGRS